MAGGWSSTGVGFKFRSPTLVPPGRGMKALFGKNSRLAGEWLPLLWRT